MKNIANWIAQIVEVAKNWQLPKEKTERKAFIANFRAEILKEEKLKQIRKEVAEFTKKFAI